VRTYLPECSPDCETVLAYTAQHGERNDVGAQRQARAPGEDFTRIRVVDNFAPLSAGPGCRALDEHTAECDIPDDTPLAKGTFKLGDGRDYLSLPAFPAPAVANVGAGNDLVTGGRYGDIFEGGPGTDALHGEDGQDTAVFSERSRHVRVDLASPALDGVPGSLDWLPNIENVYAPSARGAVLSGNRKRNVLMTRHGGRVSGRRGDDQLTVGGGGVAYGGPGDDVISNETPLGALTGPQRPRRYGCGSGKDFVDGTGLRDVVAADCENVGADSPSQSQWTRLFSHPSRSNTIAILSYGCLIADGCPLTITGRIGSPRGPVVALRRLNLGFNAQDSRLHHYALRLNAKGRTLLRRRGRMKVYVWFREGPYSTGLRFLPRQGFAMSVRR
jgi:hypothetical protein